MEWPQNFDRCFQWTNVVQQFEASFLQAFAANKKAHFDHLPDELKIVDGAKLKWSNLLLIDGLIFLLQNSQFNSSTRRAFNQARIIYQCIMDELRLIDFRAFQEISEYPVTEEMVEKYSYLSLGPLDQPWTTMGDLRSSLLCNSPSKSKNKFVSIVCLLTNHDVLKAYNLDLSLIIKLVIARVMFAFPHKVSHSSKPATPVSVAAITPSNGVRTSCRRKSPANAPCRQQAESENHVPEVDTHIIPTSHHNPGLVEEQQHKMMQKQYMSSSPRAFALPNLRIETAPGQVSIPVVPLGEEPFHENQQREQFMPPSSLPLPPDPYSVSNALGLSLNIVTAPPTMTHNGSHGANRYKRCQGLDNNTDKRSSVGADQQAYALSFAQHYEKNFTNLISPVLKHTVNYFAPNPTPATYGASPYAALGAQMNDGATANQLTVMTAMPVPVDHHQAIGKLGEAHAASGTTTAQSSAGNSAKMSTFNSSFTTLPEVDVNDLMEGDLELLLDTFDESLDNLFDSNALLLQDTFVPPSLVKQESIEWANSVVDHNGSDRWQMGPDTIGAMLQQHKPVPVITTQDPTQFFDGELAPLINTPTAESNTTAISAPVTTVATVTPTSAVETSPPPTKIDHGSNSLSAVYSHHIYDAFRPVFKPSHHE